MDLGYVRNRVQQLIFDRAIVQKCHRMHRENQKQYDKLRIEDISFA